MTRTFLKWFFLEQSISRKKFLNKIKNWVIGETEMILLLLCGRKLNARRRVFSYIHVIVFFCSLFYLKFLTKWMWRVLTARSSVSTMRWLFLSVSVIMFPLAFLLVWFPGETYSTLLPVRASITSVSQIYLGPSKPFTNWKKRKQISHQKIYSVSKWN